MCLASRARSRLSEAISRTLAKLGGKVRELTREAPTLEQMFLEQVIVDTSEGSSPAPKPPVSGRPKREPSLVGPRKGGGR